MSSIQSALLSKPLPLAEVTPGSNTKPRITPPSTEKVAKDFESVFATMMLKEMRQTLEPGSLFGEDSSDIYGGMFDQFLGQHMSESSGIGLSKMIREALDRLPAGSQGQAASALTGK